MSQEIVLVDVLREERLSKARAIINHPKFLSLSHAERTRLTDEMLRRGLSQRDLSHLIAEQKTFGILDKGVLFKILSELRPVDVISSCKLNRQFASLCGDALTFVNLMKLHYPKSFLTNNPRQQYIAITEGIETPYTLRTTTSYSNIFKKHVERGVTRKPESTPGWTLDNLDIYNFFSLFSEDYFLEGIKRKEEILKFLEARVREGKFDDKVYQELLNLLQLIPAGKHSWDPKDIKHRNAQSRLSSALDEPMKLFINLDRKNVDRVMPRWLVRLARPSKYHHLVDDHEIRFDVKGNPVPSGTTAWLRINEDPDYDADLSAVERIYRTKRELVDEFVKEKYIESAADIIRVAKANNDPRSKAILKDIFEGGLTNEEKFNLVLQNEELLNFSRVTIIPFTRENFRQHLEDNNAYMPYENEIHYRFREVIF